MEGCTNKAAARGLCTKHRGAGEAGECKCLADGCGANATSVVPEMSPALLKVVALMRVRGLCGKHSHNLCSAEGCSNDAKPRGLYCETHAKKRACSIAGCGTAVKARGVCRKHGAFGYCSFSNCTTAARSTAQGMCSRHGGGARKECKVEGCKTLSQARGVCRKHGASGPCHFDGCTTNARSGSANCKKHGGGN